VIQFGSGYQNVAGESAELDVGAVVHSTALRAWRRARDRRITESDCLTGSGLNQLIGLAGWINWNVAGVEATEVADDIEQHIRRYVFPWLAAFEDEDSLAARLEGGSLRQIAARLTADGLPTAHGGRRCWPSTARSVLLRASAAGETAVS
jgi:hypothetical protein